MDNDYIAIVLRHSLGDTDAVNILKRVCADSDFKTDRLGAESLLNNVDLTPAEQAYWKAIALQI